MKLPASLALASLSCAGTLATITLEDLPSKLKAGSIHEVKWSQDRDYVSPTRTERIIAKHR
jgi:hypothetical protein